MDAAETPASIAFLWCAFHEYCASKCLAAISSDSSRSRSLMWEPNRQYAPSASTFSASSGDRSQIRNGPRVAPRLAAIASLTSCWRGVSSVRAGRRIFLVVPHL